MTPEEAATRSLTCSAVPDPRFVRGPDGTILRPPAGWALLPPGDAGLTRRVKAAGPSWTVEEKKGRKTFSRGVWAPKENIERARTGLTADRATPQWQEKLEKAAEKRAEKQADYVEDFDGAVRAFLRFAPEYAQEMAAMAALVTVHATPVGSGTVARTERIPLDERAAAAVIAWMRHQTTDYDHRPIARIKGERRDVRRNLARGSHAVLDAHRGKAPHRVPCVLCDALSRIAAAEARRAES